MYQKEKYNYLNMFSPNVSSLNDPYLPINATVTENRNSPIVDGNTNEWLVGIDKFNIHRIVNLPIYRDFGILSVQIYDGSANQHAMATANFSGLSDSDGFIYSFDDWLIRINNMMTAACNNLGITNIPQFQINDDFSTLIYLPDHSGNTLHNWIARYKIYFSVNMLSVFRSYSVKNYLSNLTNDMNVFHELYLKDYNDSIGTIAKGSTIHLSPIGKIVVTSGNIPVKSELNSNGSINSSSASTNILTDFNFNSVAYKTPITNIEYNALSSGSTYRLHDLIIGSSFTSATLSFYFQCHSDLTLYPLKILGSISAKLVFIKKEIK